MCREGLGTSVKMRVIIKVLLNSVVSSLLLILDCCHSGRAALGQMQSLKDPRSIDRGQWLLVPGAIETCPSNPGSFTNTIVQVLESERKVNRVLDPHNIAYWCNIIQCEFSACSMQLNDSGETCAGGLSTVPVSY